MRFTGGAFGARVLPLARVERRRAAAALLWCCAVVAPVAIAALAARACAARLADLLLLWLTAFLGAVGAVKAAGRLRHDLSAVAGGVEALGALLQLPLVRRRLAGADGLGGGAAAALSAVGGWCFLAALGAIASTHKRRSPVCWSQAILAELYLVLAFSHDPAPKGGPSGVALGGLVSFLAGVGGGGELQRRFPGL